jgi:hypothetical protein
MRYTIEGFSQIEAVKFKRIETVKRKNPRTGVYEDKEAVVALDCTDLVILRWLVDFWPRMMKVEIGGVQYAWLSYKDAIEDMPLLGVKKAAFALRLKKMVDFGILSHKTVKSGGTFSYYGFGPEYMRLTDSKHAQQNSDLAQNFSDPLHKKLETPAQNFSDQIDPNTKDPSIKDNPKKERKKTAETYDSIIDGFTQDEELREALRDFLQYKVASCHRAKREFTNRALKVNLTKLSKLTSDPHEMVEIVNQTLERSWSGFFPLKSDYSQKRQPVQQKLEITEPRIGSMKIDNMTGRQEVYKGNGVWEEYVSDYVPQEGDVDIEL